MSDAVTRAGMAAFLEIQKAMITTPPKTVKFNYVDAAGKPSVREAEPYKIEGSVLVAHCLDRKTVRRFDMNNMADVAVGRQFNPRDGATISVPMDCPPLQPGAR